MASYQKFWGTHISAVPDTVKQVLVNSKIGLEFCHSLMDMATMCPISMTLKLNFMHYVIWENYLSLEATQLMQIL